MISVADIKTVEDLDIWVKYRGTKFGIYEEYKAALETCKGLVAIQYPNKKFEWPQPTLKPCHVFVCGERRNLFAHWYQFPDGFKTGVLLIMGAGKEERYITNVVFIDQANFLI